MSAPAKHLIFGLFLHGKLITSLHHKSQILKAEYSIDWSSIEYSTTSLFQLLKGKALSNLSFDVLIKNPTEYDILIEQSQIIVEKKQSIIATIELNGFEIPSGQTRRVSFKLKSNSDTSSITKFKDILEDWHVEMHVELVPGIPFIFNIIE